MYLPNTGEVYTIRTITFCIETHGIEGAHSTFDHPAVCIKAHNFPSPEDLRKHFEKPASETDEFLNYWEDIHEQAIEKLSDRLNEIDIPKMLTKAFGGDHYLQFHHQGGWILVNGLPVVQKWKDYNAANWGYFQVMLMAKVAAYSTYEFLDDFIPENFSIQQKEPE